jgi:hypothetical protein
MRSISERIAAAVASAALAGCGSSNSLEPPSSAGAAASVRSAHGCHGWRVIPSANASSTNNQLYGVTRSGAKTLWAVGGYQPAAYQNFVTLTERWNGTSWSVVPSANAGTGDNQLSGVAAISDRDVWAVGVQNATPTAQTKPLIEHWNGSAWHIVESPSPGQLGALASVAAAAPNDVWAVGGYFDFAGNQQTLVEHWNGSKWRVVASPNPGASYNALGHLVIVSAKEIWATGSSSNDDGSTSQTLVERWDGKEWSLVASPNVPGAVYNGLGGIAVVNANEMWSVGDSESAPTYATRTLVERWKGSQWSIVSSPNVGAGGNSLADVAAGPGSNLWAVGSYFDLASGIDRTLTQRWNGTAWQIVKSADPGTTYDELRAITSNAAGFWAVGAQASGKAGETLVEFHC